VYIEFDMAYTNQDLWSIIIRANDSEHQIIGITFNFCTFAVLVGLLYACMHVYDDHIAQGVHATINKHLKD
jgi:hypothetical protein